MANEVLRHYREIWCVDFEFNGDPGDRPNPVCLVGHELRSGRTIRLWRDQFRSAPPYPTDAGSLFVAYYASAELGCHRALGWPMPARILDLFTEFRARTNGLTTPAGAGLVGALTYFGLDTIGATEKEEMRALILRGPPWSEPERQAILDYCASDVDALRRLLLAMLSAIDLPRALLRGRSMAAAAVMEHNGVPIDVPTLTRLREGWDGVKDRLIVEIDREYGVFEGRTFKRDKFERWLVQQDIPWPRHDSGQLDLSDDTFRQQAKAHPRVSPLRELRSSLSELRLNDLAVGRDGRNRVLLSAFRARTGRYQPSNSKFIFGPSTWLRGLIKPPPGYGIAYIDYVQQEFGIAGARSGDAAMIKAYRTGNSYLAFGKQAGKVPADATKASHGPQHEQFKACALSVIFGAGPDALAARIGCLPIEARELLCLHHETFPVFWSWSDEQVDRALLTGSMQTVFGWPVHIAPDFNPRMLRNFLMQATSAEMLRLACCLGTERGIEICAPVHDAVLICAPLERLDADIAVMRAAMAEASRVVLNGFEISTDVSITRFPDRYTDPRGAVMWDRVMRLIGQAESATAAA